MPPKVPKPQAIIIDIEGTTTERKFVSKVLFPLIKKNLKQFLTKAYDRPDTKELISSLQTLQRSGKYDGMPPIDRSSGKDKEIACVERNILWQLSKGHKTTELKSAELLCWVWAYETNLIKGHVFDDVPQALHDWKVKSGIKLYTYSSGVSCAQKLLLCNTTQGNLHSLIDQYFDSSIGSKSDDNSYKTICQQIGVDPKNAMYITDSTSEAKCALKAGLKPVLISRVDKPKEGMTGVLTITSFKNLKF